MNGNDDEPFSRVTDVPPVCPAPSATQPRTNASPKKLHELICVICGDSHQKKDPDALYCGKPCSQEAYRRRKDARERVQGCPPDPAYIRVNNKSKVLDFCAAFGGLLNWDEHNVALVADALDIAIDAVNAKAKQG